MVSRTVLVARPDSAIDVLLAGPAVRAVSAHADRVVFLAGPRGRAAAELLPGVDRVIEWRAPWIDADPPPVTGEHVARLMDALPDAGEAVILTSFHQSALPLALLLRLRGVGRITAISEDYPGSLLDVRVRIDETRHLPEAERMPAVAAAAGFEPADGGALVAGNTGPAHLAAAVGTPVVSLFAPVVPAGRWAPYGVPYVLLGDQEGPCKDTRAQTCPIDGHPCLTGVTAEQVVKAVRELIR
ncbi:glycosyltransferase family 9 protein [Nonomuraea jabiensis]|uniref:glycosyltransferase family 9 protein n=1 Tax=Nonomuraea jabiensis TaxID=882448 RepID=UPI003426EEAE